MGLFDFKTEEKVGLALGGGATLGAAHVGVLRALEESEIKIDCIAGTSIGAMVGAFYAFGMSGISNVGSWYWQNEKDLTRYYEQLDAGKSPIFKSCTLSRDDFIRQDVIMSIMCRMGVDFDSIAERWGIDFTRYFSNDLARLDKFQSDGLVIRTTSGIHITEAGRLFLRNIAMCFDYYLNESKKRQNYSKTV